MRSTTVSQPTDAGQVPYAPGVTVEVRDEEWLVTTVERAAASPSDRGDAYLLKVRGISPYVRDTTATFYTDLDKVTPLDPSQSTVVADPSPGYRRSRLWLESTLRRTPVPLYDETLVVSTQMLADHLDYQLSAVRKALSNQTLRPRLLIADAVGLGKTLEIGMILSELIRRGRGERILVVTPRHVLEQMQQELWTRFAIPLVRLDSVGIQKVRRTLPATRNPFTFFPRVIVSIDTLKSAKYRAQLERVRWDAVVIDEVHNATNAATQNNELARLLAPTTEALILASATPHNGRAESFAELIRLLDPTAVGPDGSINARDLAPLIIRRHRHSPEVDGEVGSQWAVRAEPNNILVPASKQETALARELRDTWTRPGVQPPSGDNRLFPWTLAKAYLSSPAALIESVSNRRKNASAPAEVAALDRLQELAEQVTPAVSAKYQRLLTYLREIGISPRSDQRVVIFSERVRTLHWLAENLAEDLKLKSDAVAVMHGGLSDQEQMDLVDGFKRASSPLRVLVTGDVASEGVNLHTQCHHLVHYDIPWSLIRIQQRNGRVDRYGQRTAPVITTLLLDPPEDAAPGDLQVLTRLMEREYEAHSQLGDVASLMGEHSEAREEDTIREVLAGKKNFDDAVRRPEDVLATVGEFGDDDDIDDGDDIDAYLAQMAMGGSEEVADSGAVAQARRFSVYESEVDYLEDALTEAFHGEPQFPKGRGGVAWRRNANQTAQLEPTDDLARRLDLLPEDYVRARRVREELILATSTNRGKLSLEEAREGASETTWPIAHFLGPLHPVSDWAADRALASMARQEVPAVRGRVDSPTVLVMGTLMNRRGQVVTRAFSTVEFPMPDLATAEPVDDPYTWLEGIGLSAGATNPGPVAGAYELSHLIPRAVKATSGSLEAVFSQASAEADRRVTAWRERSHEWEHQAGELISSARLTNLSRRVREEAELAEQLRPEQRLVRPLLVVVPTDHPIAETSAPITSQENS
ncbi:Type III restriction enzyme, res subunit [Dietzia kunjamensis subsp. schimae]|uniref:Type III restriction enzyme, res subunit n=1 Tax=Dietzia kunjamensis subsp. schimae TaxID=498198 RepID=A0ABY1MX33_9ACTN|nr:DEAD/DEAH box helicase [Dietzia kunjamensis]MBB1014121.1 DEAD/DEAH box helicase [Dietzia kunjamensis subsp. schimae]SMO42150.1 Type III restriction enzyme, res subunit [Dietzia kunjamensis subsp. schimae]